MTEPVATAEPSRLPTLTSLRWYAALLVFLYHFLQWSDLTLLRPLGDGYVGVTFFFVLSGFVLAWGYKPAVRARRFWWNRFARIYPAHLVMFVLVALFFLAHPAHAEPTGPLQASTQLLLIHAWWPGGTAIGYNGVSWSLSDEAFFYLCFPAVAALFVRRRRAAALVTAGALVVGLLFAAWSSSRGYGQAATAYYLPLARLPEFLLGVWLALQVRARRLPRIPLWAALAVCAVSAVVGWRYALPWYPASDYVLLPGFSLLIVAGAQADCGDARGRLLSLLRHPASIYLGEVSFAFYLTHQVVLIGIHAGPGDSEAHKLIALAAAFVVALAAAAALQALVEKPARSWLLRYAPRAAVTR